MPRNRFYLITSDILACFAAFAIGGLAFWLIRQPTNFSRSVVSWAPAYLVIIPVCIAWLYLKGHYTRRWPFWDEMRGVCQVLVVLSIVDGALIFLMKSSFPRIWYVATFLSLFVLLPVSRQVVKVVMLRFGKWSLPTVILGAGENATDIMSAVSSERLMGFDVRFFGVLGRPEVKDINGIPVQKVGHDIEKTLDQSGVRCVIVAMDDVDNDGSMNALLDKLHRHTLDLYIVPTLRGIPLHGMEIHYFFRHEVILMRVRNNLLRPVVRFFKRALDIFGSILLLLFLSPLLIIVGLMIYMDGGSILYEHRRVGFNGLPFKCLKFRSMVENADGILQSLLDGDPSAKTEWENDHKLRDDPRITKIGSFIRNYSLDELPQLWNVLKGDMSLVGPRPLVEKELQKYGEQVNYYLHVRPGMTGLWQVSGRNDVDYSHRVYLDVWYVKNWSLWYDIAILFKTIKVVFNKGGAY